MGVTISSIFSSLSSLASWGKEKDVRILMVGLDSAGKTTILYRLQIGEVVSTIPTIGFNVESVTYKNIKFQVWDLGGQSSIRPYWRCYYANTHAIIYVIDASDHDRLQTSRAELLTMLAEEELKGVPVLVFSNKQDVPGALPPGEISDRLGLAGAEKGREWSVRGSCATKGEGLEEGLDWHVINVEDESLDGQLESLLKQQISKEPGQSPAPPASISTPSDAPIETPGGNELPDVDILDPYNTFPVEEFGTMSKNQSSSPANYSGQLVLSGWPTRLPKPDLVYHLVDVFFSCYPHAHYIIHRPSFMLSLALSPKSPNFPHVSLLHAICAYAGVFSYLIEPPPAGDLGKIYHDFIFGDRRQPDSREESFAEMHARWAKETAAQAIAMGFNLFECTQAQVILTAFYNSQGRLVELWSTVGDALRCAVPLGLNTRPGFRGDGTARNPTRLSVRANRTKVARLTLNDRIVLKLSCPIRPTTRNEKYERIYSGWHTQTRGFMMRLVLGLCASMTRTFINFYQETWLISRQGKIFKEQGNH
ncbi:unnamed protein product [Rhizoctonia solani]|uniref:Uncharacterized protein n=2 Tax=Rhizoctonia solani TaxID=456999 RepID=A0A8H3HUC1_9AGAM|nr:unnamed protein product [Rhizoctonia solani]